jgi:hypothetical protein
VLVEEKRHGDPELGTAHKLGLAVLMPGRRSDIGEVVLGVDPSLNGEAAMVEEELTSYVGRIARERGFSYLNVAEVVKERVDVVQDGQSTGQKMNVFYPVHSRTIPL